MYLHQKQGVIYYTMMMCLHELSGIARRKELRGPGIMKDGHEVDMRYESLF